MLEHEVQNWQVRKPLARSRGGVVASQNRIAAEAGARASERLAHLPVLNLVFQHGGESRT